MYEAKNFDHLLGLQGFSEPLMKNHFTLYQGYVKNTNGLIDLLPKFQPGTTEFSELHRRFGWEWNGMRLHEYYFDRMKKEGGSLATDSRLAIEIKNQFGSFDHWMKDFKGVGAMRGIGWTILYYDVLSKRLFNVWIHEHDVAHLSGAVPLLVMDVFEHAFMLDYGLKRIDYIESYFNAIDWDKVAQQFETVTK